MKKIKILIGSLLIATLMTGCASKKNNNITIVGSTAMQPMIEMAAEEFQHHSKVRITVQGGGSGTGLSQVQAGAVAIGNSDIFAQQQPGIKAEKLQDNKVAVVGIAPVVNKKVGIDNLSMDQLKGIITGKYTNWKQVGGKNQKIIVINRDQGSGTRKAFESDVLKGESAIKAQEQDSSGTVQKMIAATPGSISYLAFPYLNKDVQKLSIDNVKPNAKNVENNDWKIWAYEHMYTKKKMRTEILKKFRDEETYMRDEIREKIQKNSKATYQEIFGKLLVSISIIVILLIVSAIFGFIFSKGIATFTENNAQVKDFFTGTNWNPSMNEKGHPQVGALPMILGSFGVTLLAAIFVTPFAIGTALYITELASKKMKKILQIVIELLVGIPSVVYGFIGLNVVVPFIRENFGGTGYGILAGAVVLFVMILPTVTSLTVDSLKAVPKHYRSASLALGATPWQTMFHVTLKAATSGILTAIVFGMARAFGEALAVQMVIGNASLMPTSLLNPASTLTSVLTMGIGNTVMGTVGNNALWSLALVLLAMSLIFNLIVRLIGRKD